MFLKGLYTALITPFDSQDKLDEEGLRRNIQFQIQHQVDGLVLLGTTGETPTLTPQEQKRILQIGAEEIRGQVQFLVGTGSYSTAQTIVNTQRAADLGADGVIVITPYYNKPTQEGLYRHFKALSQASPLPICLYNHQGRTGLNIQTETLKRLLDFPNIVGVKEASGNISQMCDVIELMKQEAPHFSVLSGDDSLTLPLMASGGHGLVSVTSNLLPRSMKDLVQACLIGDFKQAQQLHSSLYPLFKGTCLETNPIPIKACMELSGMAAGSCRLPLSELQIENVKILQNILTHFSIGSVASYG